MSFWPSVFTSSEADHWADPSHQSALHLEGQNSHLLCVRGRPHGLRQRLPSQMLLLHLMKKKESLRVIMNYIRGIHQVLLFATCGCMCHRVTSYAMFRYSLVSADFHKSFTKRSKIVKWTDKSRGHSCFTFCLGSGITSIYRSTGGFWSEPHWWCATSGPLSDHYHL